MPTEKISYSVGSIVFASDGKTARMQVWEDHRGGFWVNLERSSDEIRLFCSDAKKLPMKLESKLRRLIRDYDKIGKKSIGL
jgi:hypothetical protein